MVITLHGEPKSTQHCYKSACRGNFPSVYMSNGCKALKEAWQWEAKSQYKEPAIEGAVSLSLTYYFGTKRKCDLDNFNKLTLDALTGILYNDDSQITELHIFKAYDKTNPRVEVSHQAIIDKFKAL